MARADVAQLAPPRIDVCKKQRRASIARRHLTQHLVQFLDHTRNFAGATAGEAAQERLYNGHQNCRANPVSRNIADRDRQFTPRQAAKVEEVAASFARRLAVPAVVEPRHGL